MKRLSLFMRLFTKAVAQDPAQQWVEVRREYSCFGELPRTSELSILV